MKRTTRFARALGLLLLVGLTVGGVATGTAHAAMAVAPRYDVQAAYTNARRQFDNLELDAAQSTLEGAIAEAQSAGMGSDPSVAPLLVLRAGIIYSNTGDAGKTAAAFQEAVRADYFIAIPIELRSEELQQMLESARKRVGKPPRGEPIVHASPVPSAGMDVPIEAHMRIAMMEGFQAVLYWRSEGDSQFKTVEMETFGNLAWVSIPASEHGDKTIEYAIYAFDSNQSAIANKGDTENPMRIEIVGGGDSTVGDPADGNADDGKDSGRDGRAAKRKARTFTGKKFRGFFNLGLGTGLGLASGVAELSFKQYSPLPVGSVGPGQQGDRFNYTVLEQACAIARWYGSDANRGGRVVADLAGPLEFETKVLPELANITGVLEGRGQKGPLSGLNVTNLGNAYEQGWESCDDRAPVSTGVALAPFHIAPEIGLRINERFLVSLYARLQVVTGSKVYRGDDPDQKPDLADHFVNVINSPTPQKGERDRPPFTWAVGAKFRYLMRSPEKKVRVFTGAFLGAGFARLMVNMGFANDANGNSVPDNQEIGADLVLNPSTMSMFCVPVWPYSGSCADSMTIDGGSADYGQASNIQASSSDETRIDTVVLGALHGGVLLGFQAQVHKHVAIYGEVLAGGWFPNASSFLLDLNVGPSIMF